MSLDLHHGVVAATTCLSGLPPARRYQFLLNRGLNIKTVKDSRGRLLRFAGYEDGVIRDQGIVYTLRDTLPSSDELCIDYIGAYPVYDIAHGDFGRLDDKGLVAFNGISARLAEETKWYPTLYDSTLGLRRYESLTYHLGVRCDSCATLYVNGGRPQPGPVAEFERLQPVAPLLFVGNYAWRDREGITLLNSALPDSAVHVIAAAVDSIRRNLQEFVAVPYGQSPVFMEHAIIENNPRRRWGFVTYPTIAFSGDGLRAFVDDSTHGIAPFTWAYLGHEMAHYYFGSLLVPRGPLYALLTESVAEYLSLKTVQRFQGDSAYQARLRGYARSVLADSTLTRLGAVQSPSEIGDRFRYEYGPLLLVGLEDMVGAPAMRRLLHAVLTAPSQEWDYDHLRRLATAVGVSVEQWERFERECVSPAPKESCLEAWSR